MDQLSREAVKAEVDRLTAEFFRAVSFETGEAPPYAILYGLFIESGLLIKNVSSTPEISSVHQFIEPREISVRAGDLTRFNEVELSETTDIFGNVAQSVQRLHQIRYPQGRSLRSTRHDLNAVHPNTGRMEDQFNGVGR